MTEKEQPKEYIIDSLDRLLNVVNLENCERLAIDLGQWLIYYAHTLDSVRKSNPKECDGKLNTEIVNGGFRWIDDGKNDILGVEITNQQTGEFRSHDLTKK